MKLVGQIPRYRLLLLLVLIVLGSLAEGLGILLLVPLIGLLSGNAGATVSLPESAAAVAIASPAVLLTGFAGIMIARALLQQRQHSEAAAMQRKIVQGLRLSAMHAILHAEWRWLSAQRISENSAMLLSDLTRLGWGLGHIPTLVSAAISIIVYLTVSFILSWQATLLAVVFGLAAYAAAARYRRRIVVLGEAIGASNTELHQQTEETLAGAKLIKSLGREQARIAAFGNVLAALELQHRQVVANTGRARTLIDTTSAVFLAALTYGALAWLHVPAERLLPLIIVFARFVPLLSGAQQGVMHWLNAVPALDRVTEVIDEAVERAEPAASGPPVRVATSVAVDAVSFTYPGADEPALANISLTLPAARTTAITGASGIGKSTLADIFGGLIEPDTGQLLVDGIALEGSTRVRWRQSVAYVHQDAFFFDGTVGENLRLANPAASDDDLRKALDSVAARFVDTLPGAFATRMGVGGKRFSGGERQRLALARALLASPALLILDEATSALDPETEAAVVSTIEAMRGTTTIIVISHRPISGLTVDQYVALGASSGTAI